MRTCPICGSEAKDITINGKDRITEAPVVNEEWARCKECRLWFRRNMPTPEEEYEKYRSGEYRERMFERAIEAVNELGNRATKDNILIREIINESMRAQVTIQDYVDSGYPVPKRYMDVGASLGVLLLKAFYVWNRQGMKCEVVGVEPNDKYKATSIPTVASLDEVTGTFDFITLIHVLEHMPNPVEFLQQIAQHMHDDSILILEVPNLDAGLSNPFHPDHQFVFTNESLAKVLKLAGLQPTKMHYHGWIFSPYSKASLVAHARRQR